MRLLYRLRRSDFMPCNPRFRSVLAGIAAVLLAWPISASAADGDLITLERRVAGAKLTSLDTQLRASFALADGKTLQLGPADFTAWGARGDAPRGAMILLVDGSVIVASERLRDDPPGSEVRLVEDQLVIHSSLWGEPADALTPATFPIPLSRVRGVLVRPPADLALRDRLLHELSDAKGDEDRILLENGDLLSGTLLPPVDPKLPPGAAGPPERGAVAAPAAIVRLEGKGKGSKPLQVPWGKVRGIRFSPALAALPPAEPPALVAALADGSLLRLKELRMTGPEKIELRLLGGLTLPVSSLADLPREVVALRGMSSKVVWLSDLEAQGYRHWPFLSGEWNLARDRSVGGGQLRVGGRIYEKGLGLHSRSRVIYEVPPGATRFEAEAAIDDEATGGSVIFRVFTADATGAFRPAAETPIVRSGEAPRSISAELKGAKQIALVVEYADRGDQQDHADWLLARFVKE